MGFVKTIHMLRNYLQIAFRRVRREKGYSIINVLGLAIGMACCLVITLYVREELSYDRFHEKSDRIARLVRETSAMTAAPMGPALVNDFPDVQKAVRISKMNELVIERSDGEVFREDLLAVDPAFFDVFSFHLVQGDPETALESPQSLVISETAAEKYFGTDNAMGRSLTLRGDGQAVTFTISGIARDVPETSHFGFHLLASFKLVEAMSNRTENWRTNWLYTYLLFESEKALSGLEARLPAFFETRVGEPWSIFRIQALEDVRLHSASIGHDIAPQGHRRQVMLFAIIAALVLIIACINFINLSTARAMRRSQEVGVRKAMGARRPQLVGQFMGESIVTTMQAVVVTAGLLFFVVPAFRSVVGSDMTLDASDVPFLAGVIAALVLVVGFLAGSYPAFMLSRFSPVRALRQRATGAASGGGLRRVLVVFQFAISIFLIIGTVTIYQQLDYLQNARLGIEPEQIIVLPIGDALEERHDLARREMASVPGVRAVSAAGTVPATQVSDFMYRPEGWTSDDLPGWDTFFIDDRYADVLNMEIVLGRDFDEGIGSDSSGYLLNESAWEAIKNEVGERWENPIGKQLDFYLPGSSGWEVFKSGPVVGIVKDFHYLSMHSAIGPLVLTQFPQTFDLLLARVETDNLSGTIAGLETMWAELAGGAPFEYYFLDESYDALYRTERRMGELAGVFGGLALFIACLGLFGLATFMAERRTKEIGVRKVLGATVSSIVGLLSLDFVKLVGVAFLLAAPIAYLMLREWLSEFAYRIDLSAGVFLLGGIGAVVIAVLTVSYQALRVATADPVESLRYE